PVFTPEQSRPILGRGRREPEQQGRGEWHTPHRPHSPSALKNPFFQYSISFPLSTPLPLMAFLRISATSAVSSGLNSCATRILSSICPRDPQPHTAPWIGRFNT